MPLGSLGRTKGKQSFILEWIRLFDIVDPYLPSGNYLPSEDNQESFTQLTLVVELNILSYYLRSTGGGRQYLCDTFAVVSDEAFCITVARILSTPSRTRARRGHTVLYCKPQRFARMTLCKTFGSSLTAALYGASLLPDVHYCCFKFLEDTRLHINPESIAKCPQNSESTPFVFNQDWNEIPEEW